MRFSNFKTVMDPLVSRLVIRLLNAPGDEAPLARAMRAYQEIVESLMQEIKVCGVSPECLLEFREVHGSTAFVCRVRGCKRAVLGFPSKDKLIHHEKMHLKSFGCCEKSCTYNDVGFRSARSLQDHMRNHHRSAELIPVPKQLRSAGNPSGDMDNNYLDDESDWKCIYNPLTRRGLQVNSCRVLETQSHVFRVRFNANRKRVAVAATTALLVFDVTRGSP